MRVLICGDRNWSNTDRIKEILREFTPSETIIIHGDCRGADRLTGEIAFSRGFTILPFPAKWLMYGKRAGPIRNFQMLKRGEPDLVIAFHDNIVDSKGTSDMINKAKKKNILVQLVTSTGRYWL